MLEMIFERAEESRIWFFFIFRKKEVGLSSTSLFLFLFLFRALLGKREKKSFKGNHSFDRIRDRWLWILYVLSKDCPFYDEEDLGPIRYFVFFGVNSLCGWYPLGAL